MTVAPVGDRAGRTQAAFASTLVDECVRSGLADAVVAPGSRSTPLVLAIARDGRMRVHVHLDERSAGFYALGLALASGRPALVVTTSGTAAVELHPAVVEAHHARVPLIACTADRPTRLHGVGAPQTVEQEELFSGAVRWRCSPGVPRPEDSGWWRSLAARAVAEATSGPDGPGPVHLNLAFHDPLLGEPGDLPDGRPDGAPWHRAHRSPPTPPDLSEVVTGRQGVVVAGWGADAAEVAAIATNLRWPVLADARSGCRRLSSAVCAFDPILRRPDFARAHEPDVVLTVGEPPASKVLAEWLATSRAETITVDPFGTWPDPRRDAAHLVAAVPQFGEAKPADPRWARAWCRAEEAAQRAIRDWLGRRDDLTEPGVARAVTEIGDGFELFVSSSMPIRDVEWFGSPRGPRVLANRGANGIDGVVSTALGVAAASPRPVVALLGDLALLHDTSGLLGAAGRPGSCTFVVVDNAGGGIFSFLPQAGSVSAETFERLFATPQSVDLAALAAVHGIAVEAPATVDRLRSMLAAPARPGVRLIQVKTDREENVRVHSELNAAVAAALAC